MVKIMANDGVTIELEFKAACQAALLKQMFKDLGVSCQDAVNEVIPLTVIDGPTLRKVGEWCQKNKNLVYVPKDEEEDQHIMLTPWDHQYLDVDNDMLLKLLHAANHYEIPGILDIVTQKIANMAIGRSVEEIRELYGLQNDFTSEEEEQLRRRFEWVEHDDDDMEDDDDEEEEDEE